MKLKVATEQNGEILIIEPKGALVGGEETDELRNAVAESIEKGNKKLIVDLGKVTYMNSTAIGASGLGPYLIRKSKRENSVVQCQQEY